MGQIITFPVSQLANQATTSVPSAGATTGLATNTTLAVGPGATAQAIAGAMNANGFGTTTAAAANTAEDYWSFTVTPSSGYSMTITSFTIAMNRNGTGPTSVAIRSSVDSYASDITTFTITTTATTFTATISNVANSTSSVTYRIIGYGGTGGTLRIQGTPSDGVRVFGSVSSASSPSITLTTTSFISGGNFGNQCVSTNSTASSYTVSGTNLGSTDITITPPTGFQIKKSVDPVGSFSSSAINLTPSSGSVASTGIDVRFSPSATPGTYAAANITHVSGTASGNVSVQGVGVNTAPSVTTGSTSGVNTTVATAAGTISSIGCSAITSAYGVEYSATNNFANGSGTQVVSTNLSAGAFSSALGTTPAPALVANTQYYYKAYATNSGGVTYGSQANFYTLPPAPSVGAVSNLQSTSFRINWTDITTGNQNEIILWRCTRIAAIRMWLTAVILPPMHPLETSTPA
jgi:hypothetical protein